MRIRRSDDGGSEGSDIVTNLTPMIDCTLNILFFFMVTTTFMSLEKEMGLNLPESKSGEPETAAPKEIVINILADGRMKVGDTYFEMDQLVDHLQKAALADAETPVTIRGDRETALQNAVRAMDACRRAKLHRMSVALRDQQE